MRWKSTKKECMFVLAAFSSLFLVSSAAADEIILENGDRLTGTITTSQDGTLTIKTLYSEPIKINAALISRIKSDNPVEVHLTNGEILKGALSSTADKQVEVGASHERNITTVSWDNVSMINPPSPKPIEWKGKVLLAGRSQSGNTDKSSATVGVQAVRKTDKDRFSLRALYNYGEEENVRNTENVYGALKYDYFMNEKIYTYLAVEALKDSFKDLNLRTTVGPGMGYQLWDESKKSLSFEAGLSYFNEDRENEDDDSWITARVGVNFLYNLYDRVKLTDQLLVYPSLGGEGTQLRNEAGISTSLSADWSLNLTNIYEYDTDPAPNVEKDDTTWLLGLGYSF